ncbi:sulfurtransferase [Arthrobacter oryzae]|uniref:Thiosulfate/3-mercaptopyruvate sulfurtransferase n=1 Tax=Arthrobacter oryzae TaxID=409290 RepID=A0A495FQ05_9MICC|nr:sulfurtransferase [Arthrobacter oryzae]RKR30536.1 thiosulfate/3-mercaptopyruvate sulfurtransferase [Arthrobacter oryzae]
MSSGDPNMQPFVDWTWCDGHAGRFVLVDARWYLDGSSGRDAYDAGHIPDAVFVDMDKWLSGPASKDAGRNPLPDPGVFAQGMREAGINDSDTVIAYDDAGGVIAARIVWMLRSLGRSAAVLNGGIASYPGKLSKRVPDRREGNFSAHAWPEFLLADISEASSDKNMVMDARNRDRFEGHQDPVDPRPGHIPGAVNVPCRENLDSTGTLIPEVELREKFARAGIVSTENTIAYCGSGVTACHNLLVLEHLGLGKGRLFVGGWSQYGHATSRPVETAQPLPGQSPLRRS